MTQGMPSELTEGLRVWHPLAFVAGMLQRAYGHAALGFVVDTTLALLVFLVGDVHLPWLLLILPWCMRANALVACACAYTLAFGMGVGWSLWQPDVSLGPPWAHAAFVGLFVLCNALPWRLLAPMGIGLAVASCVLGALWSMPTVVSPPRALGVAMGAWVAVGLLVAHAKPRLLPLR